MPTATPPPAAAFGAARVSGTSQWVRVGDAGPCRPGEGARRGWLPHRPRSWADPGTRQSGRKTSETFETQPRSRCQGHSQEETQLGLQGRRPLCVCSRTPSAGELSPADAPGKVLARESPGTSCGLFKFQSLSSKAKTWSGRPWVARQRARQSWRWPRTRSRGASWRRRSRPLTPRRSSR